MLYAKDCYRRMWSCLHFDIPHCSASTKMMFIKKSRANKERLYYVHGSPRRNATLNIVITCNVYKSVSIIVQLCKVLCNVQKLDLYHSKVTINPNTIKSYKIYIKSYKISQKLSPKHAALVVAQLPYPIYRHRKACLSKQPP